MDFPTPRISVLREHPEELPQVRIDIQNAIFDAISSAWEVQVAIQDLKLMPEVNNILPAGLDLAAMVANSSGPPRFLMLDADFDREATMADYMDQLQFQFGVLARLRIFLKVVCKLMEMANAGGLFMAML